MTCEPLFFSLLVFATATHPAQNIASTSQTGSHALSAPPAVICAGSLQDGAGGPCIEASSVATLGRLYPLSLDWNVDAASGHVGLGTTSPLAGLHVESNTGVIASGALGSGSAPNLGAGTRMMWLPMLGAFRAGTVFGPAWDHNNVGVDSVAFGADTRATGSRSAAFGLDSQALGYTSLAAGSSSVASGSYSASIGVQCVASGIASFACGNASQATGYGSVALGYVTRANGASSTAMNHTTRADSFACTSLGSYNIGGGSALSWIPTDPLLEIGNGSASAQSNAFTVLKNGNVGIGTHQPQTPLQVTGGSDASPSAGGYAQLGAQDSTNLVFDNNEIMARNNGVASTLSINNNGGNVNFSAAGTGRVAIGHGAPAFTLDVNGTAGKPGGGSWSVSSDARLKKNVRNLESALERLLALRGVSYEYIDPAAIGELSGERIGFVAQEVERVFPDWVGVKDDGMKFLTIRGFEALTVEALRDVRAEHARLADENRVLREEWARERMQREQQVRELRALVEACAGRPESKR